MQKRTALIAGVSAMVLGAICLVLYMQRFEREASGGNPVEVVVASQDLPLGTVLSRDMLVARELPENYLEDRHILTSDVQRIIGVRVSSAVRANESVLWTDLVNSEQRRDLSRLVENGMRAVTIEADTTSSFGGLLRPGDRVDVLMTTGQDNQHTTTAVLQNVMVLAIGADTGAPSRTDDRGERRIRQITLGVTLEQGQSLALAQAEGDLTLVLRNPEDITTTEQLPARTTTDLLGAQAAATKRR